MILLSKSLNGKCELVCSYNFSQKVQNSQLRDKLWFALKCCCITRALKDNAKQTYNLVSAEQCRIFSDSVRCRNVSKDQFFFMLYTFFFSFSCFLGFTGIPFCIPVSEWNDRNNHIQFGLITLSIITF